MADVLYFVIPCYNEEEVLPETSRRLKIKMTKLIGDGVISPDSKVCFVNDGSKDKTWEIISDLHEKDPLFSGINLSRNRGHQNALLAGLMTVKDYADMAISMDADLQDDIEACDAMIQKYYEGCDIVYGVRSARTTDTWFKRTTAQSFYKMMEKSGAKLVYNHADYRLMSRRALEGLSEFGEVNLFLRGIVPMIGYPSDVVYYERAERFAGESKYPLKKMISFALDGITSLTTEPIQLIVNIGFVFVLFAIVILIYSIVRYAIGATVPGWTFLNVSVWLVGGMLMMSVGIIGQYVGKIYLEAKHRPRYIIERFVDEKHGFVTGEKIPREKAPSSQNKEDPVSK